MGQTTDQGHSPEEERVSQKELVQACQPILGLSSFPVLFLRMLPESPVVKHFVSSYIYTLKNYWGPAKSFILCGLYQFTFNIRNYNF